MSVKTLFQQELQEIRRDLRRPVFLFGAALAYLIVFGILYLPNIVTAVPCVRQLPHHRLCQHPGGNAAGAAREAGHCRHRHPA